MHDSTQNESKQTKLGRHSVTQYKAVDHHICVKISFFLSTTLT